MIVDDSALMRQLLTDILRTDPALEVVGAAPDPYTAWDRIKQVEPDVLTLDVEMPRMDGLTFLDKLMSNRPMPVVMVSSLTEKGCETTFRALELGAVDFVTKPKLDMTSGTLALTGELVSKVKAAARARVQRRSPRPAPPAGGPARAPAAAGFRTTHKVIAIGASTGGCEALVSVLSAFPPDAPGTVAVIHMPEGFTKSFAARLDRLCAVRVSEARDGDRVVPGHVLLAPGNFHLEVARSGAMTVARVRGGEAVSRHRPSVDVLFQSCARELGTNAAAAILTGMGDDGARGLAAMRRAGAHTIAQDEATCVVFGMPKEAIALGGASQVLPLDRIPEHLLRAAAAIT
ncbi:protein-glutamate methylesterase/protein-glutamine glutaminase [Gemmata algarum]|uniref:protein-glutamate methylesterase/protein-glutamine glutaminase n=2 Tax=Gemmata algarum TaxID=2975278 RepID=UPI0039C94172